MRAKLSNDWPSFLPQVVTALNAKPLRLLGNLSPGEINSTWDDALVRLSRKEIGFEAFEQPDWQKQNENQETYTKSKNPLQVGQYVYLDKKTEIFDKSFYSQVNYLFHRNLKSK